MIPAVCVVDLSTLGPMPQVCAVEVQPVADATVMVLAVGVPAFVFGMVFVLVLTWCLRRVVSHARR